MMAPSETVIGILKRLRRILAKSRDDFDGWARYLGDAPLATAMLDRLVDGAVVIKIKGASYGAGRVGTPLAEPTR